MSLNINPWCYTLSKALEISGNTDLTTNDLGLSKEACI